MTDEELVERVAEIDAIAADLLACGNCRKSVKELAEAAKAWQPGTPVEIPGRPHCRGYVALGVTEGLQVNVTSSLDNMRGAIFSAPGNILAAIRNQEQTDER